jgi:hypothetical protein
MNHRVHTVLLALIGLVSALATMLVAQALPQGVAVGTTLAGIT